MTPPMRARVRRLRDEAGMTLIETTIACGILVVTLETSDKPTEGPAGAGAALSFEHAMIELGMLAILTLVLAIAIYLSRRSRSQGQ